jgi:hypothetical protein
MHIFVPPAQGLPSVFNAVKHKPVAALQIPTSWHSSIAAHMTGLLPMHAPARQVSVCVQASPSLHAAPVPLSGFEQMPVAGLQVPTEWH